MRILIICVVLFVVLIYINIHEYTYIGTLTIGTGVAYIGRAAFYQCTGFTGSLIIPESVTEIASYVCHGCSGFTGMLNLYLVELSYHITRVIRYYRY